MPERSYARRLAGWLLFPIALFPLVALLTYDWAAIPALQTPPSPSTNWIGALGDVFSYTGYCIFGLAVWIIPVRCVTVGLRLVSGASLKPTVKTLWFLLFLAFSSCLVQIMESHAPGVMWAKDKLNLQAAGGFVGYIVMQKAVAPLLSDIGAGVLTLVLMIVSLVGSIGLDNIVSFLSRILSWARGDAATFDPGDAKPGTPEYEEAVESFEAAKRAQEAAKRQREEEKARLRREKEAARAEKEAAKAEKERLKKEAAEKVEQEKKERKAKAEEIAAEEAKVSESGGREKQPYILPPVSLLNPLKKSVAQNADVAPMCQKLVDTLKLFDIDASISYTIQGPVVTKYALMLAPGTRYSAVKSIADNLKGALHAKSLRIEAPIPGEECVGIEVPNDKPIGISFREVFESDAWKNSKAALPLLFGKDAAGKELIADLATMPHLLVAGATGQGKSVCLNSIINGLLMSRTPEQLKLIMVDPKSVEFTAYANIPHLLVPVITDNKKVVFSLHWAVAEMEKRLKLFARAKVRNIHDFNHRKLVTQTDMFGEDTKISSDMPVSVPYIVVIIDELADLMSVAAKEVNPDIARLAAKARAAGIHLILATQRPDTKVINGTIKSNIPGRVAFKTSQSIDSRTILDETGAESLIGRGDMLFKGKDNTLVRAQGAWISDEEIANVTSFIEEHSEVQFDEKFATKLGRVKEAAIEDPFASNEDDPDNQTDAEAEQKAAKREQVKLAADADDFKKAVECVINTKRASTSHFQRQLGWGYNHAAKILDMLTARGIVSEPQGMGPRQIVMDQDQLMAILNGDGADAGDAGADDASSADSTGEAGDGEPNEEEI